MTINILQKPSSAKEAGYYEAEVEYDDVMLSFVASDSELINPGKWEYGGDSTYFFQHKNFETTRYELRKFLKKNIDHASSAYLSCGGHAQDSGGYQPVPMFGKDLGSPPKFT